MNTSTRISVVTLTVAVAFCFAACPFKENARDTDDGSWKFNLHVHGTSASEAYLPVNKDDFDKALCNLNKEDSNTKKKKGFFNIDFKPSADATPIQNYQPTCPPSEAGKKSAAGASAGGDPNATQHVRVDSPGDLKAVLDAFAEPSPSSSH
jgi:hypothetical protein